MNEISGNSPADRPVSGQSLKGNRSPGDADELKLAARVNARNRQREMTIPLRAVASVGSRR